MTEPALRDWSVPWTEASGASGWEPPQSLALPPLDRLRPDEPSPDVLAAFVEKRARAWGGVPVPLSVGVTAALWVLFVLNLALTGWLLVVGVGAAACSGFVCTVATLGGHALLTIILTGACAGALAVTAALTRGLTEASGPQLAVVVAAGLCGVVALAGVVALLVGAALGLALAVGVLFMIAERL